MKLFHRFRGEGFGLIIEDLLALPPDQGLIAVGFSLLPHLVKPLLRDPNHCVWLIPTPEFRLTAFESRGTMWNIPNKASNPKRALSNLFERDQLVTERLPGTIETTGLPAVAVDGHLTRWMSRQLADTVCKKVILPEGDKNSEGRRRGFRAEICGTHRLMQNS